VNHDAAVDTVCHLLQNLEGRPPAEVLLKYAGDRRLAPAQLEKLAHIYNTASTLAANEKERGSVPHLLDVPAMLVKYAAESGKAAPGRRSFMDDAPEPRRSVHISVDEVPVIWSGVDTPAKAASAPTPAPPPSPFGGRTRAVELCKLAEALSDAMATCHMDAGASITRVADVLKTRHDASLALHKLAADIHALRPALHNNRVLSKVASLAGIDTGGDIPEAAKPPPMLRDRTGLIPECAAAASHLEKAAAAWDSCVDILSELQVLAGQTGEDYTLARSIAKVAASVESRARVFGLIKDAAPGAASASNIVTFPTFRALGDAGDKATETGVEMIRGSMKEFGDRGGGQVFEGARSNLEPFFVAARGMGGVPLAVAGTAGRVTGNTLELAREFMPGGELPNYLDARWGVKNRADAEDAYFDRVRLREDTEAAAILQDLMIRDEIISKQDPERVLEAWREIRNASPEVAGSKSTLRLLLRQALSTQGMDIDTATAARKYENSGTWNPKGPYRVSKD
jgi:hypothetical protein